MIISFPPCDKNLSVRNQPNFTAISNLLLCNEINLIVMSLLFSKRPYAHLQIPKSVKYGICLPIAHENSPGSCSRGALWGPG